MHAHRSLSTESLQLVAVPFLCVSRELGARCFARHATQTMKRWTAKREVRPILPPPMIRALTRPWRGRAACRGVVRGLPLGLEIEMMAGNPAPRCARLATDTARFPRRKKETCWLLFRPTMTVWKWGPWICLFRIIEFTLIKIKISVVLQGQMNAALRSKMYDFPSVYPFLLSHHARRLTSWPPSWSLSLSPGYLFSSSILAPSISSCRSPNPN